MTGGKLTIRRHLIEGAGTHEVKNMISVGMGTIRRDMIERGIRKVLLEGFIRPPRTM